MKSNYLSKIAHFLFVAIFVTMVTACKDTEEQSTNISDAPMLPPVASMSIDFDAVTEPQQQSVSIAGAVVEPSAATQSSSYFAFAAFQVGGWSTLIKIGMAVPVAAFVESFRHLPIKQPDGSWVRTYAVTVSNVLYTAQLYSKLEDEQVHWDMYISKEGEYTRFNWFSGVSEIGAGSGYWIINKNPTDPIPLVQIDWNWDRVSDTGDVRFTNIEPEGAENGGYIYYGNNEPEPYQAFYDIYNKGQDNLIEIEMNTDTHEGRVRNLQHFGNEDWHYWDSRLRDTVPPTMP